MTEAALRDAWDNSMNEIIAKQKQAEEDGTTIGKFVINMSYGRRMLRGHPDTTNVTDMLCRLRPRK